MTPYDRTRAEALAKIFSAQELDYLTDLVLASDFQTDANRSRLEDIIWEAQRQSMEMLDQSACNE